MSSEVDFPDLWLRLDVAPSAGSAKPCLARIQQILLSEHFNTAAFGAAAQRATRPFKPISLESGDFAGSRLSPTRLRVIGEQVLKQLYARDPTLQPLLSIYDYLNSESNNYAAFLVWLEKQRASNRLGFYPTFDQAVFDDWGGAISTPSVRPVPQHPKIEDSGEIQVRAPNVGGRSFVVVRCVSVRDSCLQRIGRSFCSKTAEQMGAADRSNQIDSHASLRCKSIGFFGVSGWMIAESESEALLRWLKEELGSRQLKSFDIEGPTIEYAILVTTT